MLYAMAWRDLRGTFIAAAIFVTVIAASAAFAFKLAMVATVQGATNPSWAQLAREPHAYERFLDAMWFRVPGPSFVIAIAAVLVATAIPLRARGSDMSFLLLLPLRRRAVLGTRIVVFAALMFALSLAVSLVFVLLGWLALGQTYPVGKAIGVTILFTIGSLGWAGVSVAIASFVHRAIAAAIVLTIIYLVPLNLFQLTIPPTLGPGAGQKWNLWAMTDPSLWFPGIPWTQIAVTLVAAVAGWIIAVKRLEAIDV
jgi:hypothetical protein